MTFLGFKDVQHFLCLVAQTKNFSVLVHLNNFKSTQQPTALSDMNASERAVSWAKKKKDQELETSELLLPLQLCSSLDASRS